MRGGTREDRMLREITVSLPPMIARRDVPFSAALASKVESAVQEITALDNSAGETLDALGVLLLRTESVASSKIERVQASLEDYARALHGIKTNPSAVSMVAATRALTPMVGKVGETGVIDLETITDSHAALMIGEPAERDYAGRLRDMQNWVGGSDHSPRAAVFVPPPPDTVQSYLEDLISFSNRDDLPVLVQAAIAHAQFESIHPFIDGNGRIGRACGRGEAHRNSSRGHPEPVEVRDRAGPRRQRHGQTARPPARPTNPVRRRRLYAARNLDERYLQRHRASALRRRPTSLTDRKRNRVWGAALVLDELDDLGVRIARAAR